MTEVRRILVGDDARPDLPQRFEVSATGRLVVIQYTVEERDFTDATGIGMGGENLVYQRRTERGMPTIKTGTTSASGSDRASKAPLVSSSLSTSAVQASLSNGGRRRRFS